MAQPPKGNRKLTVIALIALPAVAVVIMFLLNGSEPRESAALETAEPATETPSQTDEAVPADPVDDDIISAEIMKETLDDAVDMAIKVSEEEMAAQRKKERKAARIAEYARRRETAKQLTAYRDLEKDLKERILAEFGEVTPENVGTLVERARQLEQAFWNSGDFDNVGAFDHINEARAILELCLEAEATNETALRAMVQVISSGWPNLFHNYDPELDRTIYGRSSERNAILYKCLWTLWEHHIRDKVNPTFEDLCVVDNLSYASLPYSEYKPVLEEFRRENPDVEGKSLGEAIKAARESVQKERAVEAINWMIETSERLGGDWLFYRRSMDFSLEQAKRWGAGNPLWPKRWPNQSLADEMRYFEGRFISSFDGPEERKAKMLYRHEHDKNRRQ